MSRSGVVHAAELKIYVNGELFGVATGMNWEINDSVAAIHGIDRREAFELAEGAEDVTGSLRVFRLRGDGGLEGRGITALPHEKPLEKYISLTVTHRRTDELIFQSPRVRISTQKWDVTPKGLLQGSVTFRGIGYINESA